MANYCNPSLVCLFDQLYLNMYTFKGIVGE